MTDAIGLIIMLLGQALALVFRLMPGIKNTWLPKIVWLCNFLALAAGWGQHLLDAIGPAAGLDMNFSGHFAIAFGPLGHIASTLLNVFVASGVGAIQSWVWEQFGKKVMPAKALEAGRR